MAEAAIRQRVADGVEAVRAKDIDAVMALYASNIVSFDIGPPLRYSGADHKTSSLARSLRCICSPHRLRGTRVERHNARRARLRS